MSQQEDDQYGGSTVRVPVVGGTLDQGMLEHLTEIAGFVPVKIRREFWAYANSQLAVAKFLPRRAEAMRLAVQNLIDMALWSIPRWEQDEKLFIAFAQLEQFVKVQVWRAETVDPRNERAFIGGQAVVTENRTPGQAPHRKKFLGLI